MPDDPPRTPSGQQSDPRPAAGAPTWWGALGRPDLPLDGAERPAPARPAPPAHGPRRAATGRVARRWQAWALNLAVLAVAVLIICIGVGAVSLKAFLTAGLLFGVPLLLAGVTVAIVSRRSH